jgi:hypothetical protein
MEPMDEYHSLAYLGVFTSKMAVLQKEVAIAKE